LFDENSFEITGKTLAGLENLLAEDIASIGGTDILVLKRAVSFRGNLEILYKANLQIATALKFLIPIKKFHCKTDKVLYEQTIQIEWEKFITPDMTIAVDSTINSDNFNHANYVALKVKDAIVDRMRLHFGRRSDVDAINPSVGINVYISGEECIISLDSSGDSLHKRGYRISQTDAPLNEVLAAGLVRLSGWTGNNILYDPMCGSGTIVTEAYLLATQTAPGNYRSFGFMKWKNYDHALWGRVKGNAKKRIKTLATEIYAGDISQKSVDVTLKNLSSIGLQNMIKVKKADFLSFRPHFPRGITIIMNPPYGERLDDDDDILFLYKQIGDKLKEVYKNSEAWIFSGNLKALKHVGLRHELQYILFNGPIECRYRKYEMYEGSRKRKYQVY
jgi:putative N6-adenine-specific DNA methylase